MKKCMLTLGVLLCSIFIANSQEKVRKAIMVIVDGIPADMVERLNPPTFEEISQVGGYTRAFTGGETGKYNESPTISAVCYAHLVNGVWTHKHNIWGNGLKAPNFNYPSLFWYLKQQDPSKKIAIYSSWEDNRTKLIGEGKAEIGGMKFDFYEDGFELDTVMFPNNPKKDKFLDIDNHVAKLAAKGIRENAPDLSWVYLQYTDNVGHGFGNSPEMDKAIFQADAQVRDIWEAVKYREENHNEEWLVYVVTDHGRDDKGYHHGGQSHRERTIWFTTNDKNLNPYFHQNTPGLVDVFPTIVNFLDIHAPENYQYEWDGVPLSGEISHKLVHAQVEKEKNQLQLEWTPYDRDTSIEVLISLTNNHKEGGKDEYISLGLVPSAQGKATFDLKNLNSEFYKVVLKSSANTSSRWVEIH